MAAMSHAISVQTNPSILGSGGSADPPRVTAAPAAAAPVKAKPVQLYVNPTSQVDPGLGLVVLEFHDATGKLVNSIPSQRQLNAYRTHQETPPGQQAPKGPDGTASSG
jgi:hypothetical protein